MNAVQGQVACRMTRFALLGCLAFLGCTDCVEKLRNRALRVDPIAWPEWSPASSPEPHLVLQSRGVLWDEATEASYKASSTGQCPEPIPPAPRSVATFDGDELESSELDRLLRSGSSVRIEPEVPFSHVRVLFDAYRAQGVERVELRQHRCSDDACRAEVLSIGLALGPQVFRSLPISQDHSQRFERPAEQEHLPHLKLTLIQTSTGWAIRGAWPRVTSNCREADGVVPNAAGFGHVVECLFLLKQQFPAERVIAFFPRREVPWQELAHQIAQIRMHSDVEMFGAVIFPDSQDASWPQ